MRTNKNKGIFLLAMLLNALLFYSCKTNVDPIPIGKSMDQNLKIRDVISSQNECYDYRFYYDRELGKGTISVEYCDGSTAIVKLDSSVSVEVPNVKKYELHSETGVMQVVSIQPHN